MQRRLESVGPGDGPDTRRHRRAPDGRSAYPFLRPPVKPDEIGRLANYRVLGLLGEGAMGLVFRAEDVSLRRPVALKVLKPSLSDDLDAWQRFVREARAMAAIKHDHLATVYQAGQEGTLFYLAMELLEGESLDDRLWRGHPPDVGEIVRLGREITAGLAAVHAHGLVHRDIKPANIWLEGRAKRVKILDFGLARPVNDDTGLTQRGMILGTPAFMSPEQARGEAVDARSDLFSLGCVLYCLCTGSSPFHADSTMEVLSALAVKDPQPVHEVAPGLPTALSQLVMCLLEKDLDDRPESAEAVLGQLKKIEAQLDDLTLPFAATLIRPWSGRTRAFLKRHFPLARRWKLLSLALVVVAVTVFTALSLAPTLVGLTRSPREQPSAPTALESAPVFLNTLQPIERWVWDFKPPPEERPERPDQGPPPVCVGGKPSPAGIFMHPFPPGPGAGRAWLRYRLGKEYDTFHAEVSLNDGPPESENPLTFRVLGDGRQLWQSRPVSTQKDTQPVTVSVRGVDVLTIEVHCSGHVRGAHAVWIEPRLIR